MLDLPQIPNIAPQIPVININPARDIVEDLFKKYQEMAHLLGEGQELRVVHYNQIKGPMPVTGIMALESHLIVLQEEDQDGTKYTVFVHPSSLQLTFLQVSLKKDEPKRTMGFKTPEKELS